MLLEKRNCFEDSQIRFGVPLPMQAVNSIVLLHMEDVRGASWMSRW